MPCGIQHSTGSRPAGAFCVGQRSRGEVIKQRSMTATAQTKPIFTRRQLVALLLPLVAEQALSVTIGLADTLMVSSVGEAAVSGVSLVDTFNTLMIQITNQARNQRNLPSLLS